MKFGLAITVTKEILSKSDVINSLSVDLKEYFKNKQYGNDVKSFTIGVVCVSPQFEQFFKMKKPKYVKGIKTINPEGIPFTIEDNLEYSIKIDYEYFKNADEEQIREMLALEILNSLEVFEKMKSKIKEFDLINFKVDLEDYFKRQKLIS